jgi:hypothetical protein
MSNTIRALAIAAIALVSAPAATQAQVIPLPVPQVQPQINNPGPQIAIPAPGNPVQQLSPIQSTRPSSAGQVSLYAPSRIPLTIKHSRHRHARMTR